MSNTWIYRIIAGLLIAVVLQIFFPVSESNPRPEFWHIQAKDPVSILGLEMHKQTLSQAVQTLKVQPEIAMFTQRQRQGEPEPAMHLEAFFEDVFDEGDHIILGLDASDALLRHIKKEAYRPELYPNNTIRVGVQERLLPEIMKLPFHSITIIAENTIMFEEFKKVYGKPDKLIDDGSGNAHFLYPALGLDFIQPSGGEQVLQFVTPEKFDKALLQPLLAKQHKDK